jgi:hypothetical protein
MTTPEQSGQSSTELALLRGELMTALTEIRGDVRLVIEQNKHAERRADDQAAELRRHDDRLDELERTAITRTELETREQAAAAREQAAREATDKAAHRRLIGFGLILTSVFGVISAVIAVISIIAK